MDQGYRDQLLGGILPSLVSSAQNLPQNISNYVGNANQMYQQQSRRALEEAMPGVLNNLAARNMLNSSVASDAVSKTAQQIIPYFADKTMQAGMDAAQMQMNVPSILSNLAALGQYSTGMGQSTGGSLGESFGQSMGQSQAQNTGMSFGQSVGGSQAQNTGTSFGQSLGGSQAQNTGSSFGQSMGQSSGASTGGSYGQSSGSSISDSFGQSMGSSLSDAMSKSSGQSTSQNKSGSTAQSGSQNPLAPYELLSNFTLNF